MKVTSAHLKDQRVASRGVVADCNLFVSSSPFSCEGQTTVGVKCSKMWNVLSEPGFDFIEGPAVSVDIKVDSKVTKTGILNT